MRVKSAPQIQMESTMSLITAFEIITLAGVSLSLLAVVMFEMADSIIDRKRSVTGRKPLILPARRAISATSGVMAVAANNQQVDLPKAA